MLDFIEALAVEARASTNSMIDRAVVLNLRIRSKQTEHLGVDWHVCELQLSLRVFELSMVCWNGACSLTYS